MYITSTHTHTKDIYTEDLNTRAVFCFKHHTSVPSAELHLSKMELPLGGAVEGKQVPGAPDLVNNRIGGSHLLDSLAETESGEAILRGEVGGETSDVGRGH